MRHDYSPGHLKHTRITAFISSGANECFPCISHESHSFHLFLLFHCTPELNRVTYFPLWSCRVTPRSCQEPEWNPTDPSLGTENWLFPGGSRLRDSKGEHQWPSLSSAEIRVWAGLSAQKISQMFHESWQLIQLNCSLQGVWCGSEQIDP